jgi:hypothetical protein
MYPDVRDSFNDPGVVGVPCRLDMTAVTVSTRSAFDGVHGGPPIAMQLETPANTVPVGTETPLRSCGTRHSPAGPGEAT